MQNVTAGYGRLSNLMHFFWAFSYIINCLKRYNFIKVLQIVQHIMKNHQKLTSLMFFQYLFCV